MCKWQIQNANKTLQWDLVYLDCLWTTKIIQNSKIVFIYFFVFYSALSTLWSSFSSDLSVALILGSPGYSYTKALPTNFNKK